MKKIFEVTALLPLVLSVFLLGNIGMRTFWPAILLPKWDIPLLVLLSLAALLWEYGRGTEKKRSVFLDGILAALAFGLLPWAAATVSGWEAVRLGIVGGVVFAATSVVFAAMQERLSSGGAAKSALIWSAVGWYLAAQGWMGIR